MKTVVAAYCYTGTGKDHKVALITSSSGKWIIPKGQLEKGRKKQEIALLEAWEEAGIIGIITSKAHIHTIRYAGKALWYIYEIKILCMEKKWPESGKRKRRLVTPDKAHTMISKGDLGKYFLEISREYT